MSDTNNYSLVNFRHRRGLRFYEKTTLSQVKEAFGVSGGTLVIVGASDESGTLTGNDQPLVPGIEYELVVLSQLIPSAQQDTSWFGWFPGWFGATKVKLLSLAALKEAFATKKYKHIVVVVGAGISVSAGIPDFRTPGVGLYSVLDKHSLPTMESIFDIEYLKKDPAPFYEALQSLIPFVEKAEVLHMLLD